MSVTIHLQPQCAKLADENPWGLYPPPLYHQLRTYRALQTHHLVVNTHNTGTGKTVASLLHLFALQGQGKNVLFIAPTNALLDQHAEDIEAFVERYGLEFRVIRIYASKLREMMAPGDRPGETLQRLIQNPLEYADSLAVPPTDQRKVPIVLVVNPDIFYYALYFRYGTHDQRNVFEKILTAFDYIVIDEFHYYDSKQLANFLFFFMICRQFGYFDVRGRRISLLSATPNERVIEYLGRVFPADDWIIIGPENEPAESDELATTPVLTELELEIDDAEIQNWTASCASDLRRWTSDGQDGAIISSALWRVNQCYAALRSTLGESDVGRITGPEREEDRRRATARSLILATPTVDIGYNFRKKDKSRQNIDFLICDARYGDEVLQRIGRAGRVLGKPETDVPSRAVALLDSAAYAALKPYAGRSLSRSTFADIIRRIDQLPPKQTLYSYIRTHAITECFYPIYKLQYIMPDELQEEIECLFRTVRDVFAPGSECPSWSLKSYFGKHRDRKKWLRQNRDMFVPDRLTAAQVVDWFRWLDGTQYAPSDLMPLLPNLTPDVKQTIRDFVAGQVFLTESLFSFRDSFRGPVAVVYDPRKLLSSQTLNAYNLLHIVSNFRVRWLRDRRDFVRAFGEPEEDGELFGILEGWRDPRLSLGFAFVSSWPRREFDERVCRRPVALEGFRIMAREMGGDPCQLDPRVAEILSDRLVCVLGIAPDDGPVVYAKLRGTTLYPRRLRVTFAGEGRVIEDYLVFVGTQAFQAHAELRGYFWMKERLSGEAIIV